ncbi:MAG: SOUL family heme-binding protein [Cetobacterium sp.]
MKLFSIIKIIICSFIFTACSIVGYRTSEEAGYTLISADKDIEIRQLDSTLVAEVTVPGGYDYATNAGFKKLAKYIFGENTSKDEISMTAPVLQEKSEKINMTAPVLQEKTGESWSMQFTMPKKYTLETLPKPLDKEITIKEIPSKKVAVLTYSGLLTEKKIDLKTLELEEWCRKNNVKQISAPRSLGYDPPWTLPFLRRNEITVDIE